ncbi:MAG: nucleotidyltransferase domain-containing protein [Bacteroidetes bacterium]|nr:nucleotidyltransferase domain-containing protein [Bacteroidota bacterium]MBU2583755.1 nucleotidyltransferase domain-containing protein [Bacteroidota bacterium]
MTEKEKIEKVIKELSEILRDKYSDFNGIYFFGSRVKGGSDEFSDYDIAIVFDRIIGRKFKDEIRKIVYDLELKYEIIIDSHIYSHFEILKPITPFRENVKNHGIFYGS